MIGARDADRGTMLASLGVPKFGGGTQLSCSKGTKGAASVIPVTTHPPCLDAPKGLEPPKAQLDFLRPYNAPRARDRSSFVQNEYFTMSISRRNV